jgi:hypothetical protein
MDDVFPGHLVCTANDVRIAVAENIVITDPCDFQGDSVTFTADFRVELTAQARYDIGLYFAVDGDLNNDGALTGQCVVNTISDTNSANFVQLDAAPDNCGDIDDDNNPQIVHLEITTTCIDPDEDGKLNLPNCVSWRQPGANEVCTSPSDAFPGSPSKCNCDIGFNVDIPVPPATIEVTKTAAKPQCTGGIAVTSFTVEVVNLSTQVDVDIDTLTDDIYGDITTTGHDGITATTCSVPQTLQAENGVAGGADTYTCSFTAQVSGAAGTTQTDTVTASGFDENDNPVTDSAVAEVKIPGCTR